MRRADRLFRIVQQLRGGRHVTAGKLAEVLEVSKRTIYRDVADLQASGVPIDGEAGFGYVMEAGYDLPPLMFDRDEIAALVAGARLVQAWGGTSMARAAEEALVKISEVLPSDLRGRVDQVQVHSMGLRIAPETRARIDDVDAAIAASRRLNMTYSDEDGHKTKRTVRPLGLWFWAPEWTLVGWCELRNDFRMFRLDRIAALQAGDAFRPERGKTLKDFVDCMRNEAGTPPAYP